MNRWFCCMLGHPFKKTWPCKEARDILLAAVVLESGITEAAQQRRGIRA